MFKTFSNGMAYIPQNHIGRNKYGSLRAHLLINMEEMPSMEKEIKWLTNRKYVPQILVCLSFLGGFPQAQSHSTQVGRIISLTF